MPRPRWALQAEAIWWRNLMNVGMTLHRQAHPRPAAPSFRKRAPVTVSPMKGHIELLFYCPQEYTRVMRHHGTAAGAKGAVKPEPPRKWPVVVNFHGGGFTLGRGDDDARWAEAVVKHVDAVVVSVEYRLAPEHPFPTAVEDGADAILYLVKNHEDLCIDPRRIAVSGFSAGGNMAFTVPMRVRAELLKRRENTGTVPGDATGATKETLLVTTDHPVKRGDRMEGEVVAIVAWYPSTDFTLPRAERRLTNLRPDKELPKLFTNLFDASYLWPPTTVSMSDPYLSPGVAPDDMVLNLPEDIIMYTCGWDELLAEGERFRDRLLALGKKVRYRKVEDVPHAWDKSPNPLRWDPEIDKFYREACVEVRRALYEDVEEVVPVAELPEEGNGVKQPAAHVQDVPAVSS